MRGAPDHLRRPFNITQITPASLAADAGTLSAAMTGFNATLANRTAAHAALQTASDAAKTFIAHGKECARRALGQRLQPAVGAAGWTDNSTAIPNTQPGRRALVQTLDGFLTANASFAVNAPLIVFTAAQAQAEAALRDSCRRVRRAHPSGLPCVGGG